MVKTFKAIDARDTAFGVKDTDQVDVGCADGKGRGGMFFSGAEGAQIGGWWSSAKPMIKERFYGRTAAEVAYSIFL